MSLPKERIAYLLEAYTSRKATAQEEQELMEWMQEAQEDSELRTYIADLWNQHKPTKDFSYVNWDRMFNNITRSDKVFSIAPEPKRTPVRWPRIAAAVLVLLAASSYFIFYNKSSKQEPVVVADLPNDVAPPAANKATLTLSNGRVIILDSAGTGSLAVQGAVNANKVNDGELVYADNAATVVEYHTLHVPKGSKPMQLQLADGSQVWLNAASGISFPTVFTGKERKVSITGEAYFEVAKHANQQFLVTANGTTTEVLGTHFNVNAYENESAVKITLLEGSVNVSSANQSARLKPGQQAILGGENINVLSNVNIEEVMAWKNGMFEFNETDIQAVMRQIERWYNVEVVFEGNVTQHFNGTIQRQVNASKVLNMLEKTGGVRFTIEDRKVIVKKY